jgi:hypothetical protein
MNTNTISLKEAVDLASLGINIHIEISRSSRQTRNGLNVRSESVPETAY